MLSSLAHSSVPQCHLQRAYLGQKIRLLVHQGSLGHTTHSGFGDLRCDSRNTYKKTQTYVTRNNVVHICRLSYNKHYKMLRNKFQMVPLPSFVWAAVFRVVIQLSETLVELRPCAILLQVWHGQFVLFLHKGLE